MNLTLNPRIRRGLLTLALAALSGARLLAQSSLDTGSIRGRVLDGKGAPLPGAVVRVRGPQGVKGTETDDKGNYNIPFLTPGSYEVTVLLDGYATQVQKGVVVAAQQVSGQSFRLSEGSETVIVRAGASIDTHTATTTTKINLAEAVRDFAQQRNFTAAFDFAPGAIANSGVGGGNYSFGGASGLENQYLVGGVNITNSGYGAIGAYDSVHGPTGTGMTTEFLDNLDIRDGGFDAEYGGALGGVVSASVKSGGNDFHGEVFSYWQPSAFDGARGSIRRAGGYLNSRGSDNLDAGFSIGGPLIRDRLFFFVGYNPVWSRQRSFYDLAQSDIALDQVVAPFANTEYDLGRVRTDNYAMHLTWSINEKHKLDLIWFGSPQTNSGLLRNIGRRIDAATDTGLPVKPANPNGATSSDPYAGATGTSRIRDYSISLKYFGVITPWMNVEAQVSRHRNQIQERPTAASDIIRYDDDRRLDIYNAQSAAKAPTIVSPSIYTFGGLGFYQGGSNDENTNYLLKVSHTFNWAGSHELKWGLEYADLRYRENILNSGQPLEVYTHAFGSPTGPDDPDSYAMIRTGVQVTVRCFGVQVYNNTIGTACPQSGANKAQYYRVYRGNFNPATPDTYNHELNAFIQDRWTIRNVTLDLGVRYTREKIGNPSSYSLRSTRTGNPLVGNDGNWVGTVDQDCAAPYYAAGSNIPAACYPSGPGSYVGTSYQFQGEFSPRMGISWDVMGNGKSKLYFKLARLYERVPNDLAVRSFGNEYGVTNIAFNNPDLTGQYREAFTTGAQATRVQKGTRLPYKDDYVLGYTFEVGPNMQIDVKANFRSQGRVLEDTQTSSVESILNYYYSPLLNPNYCYGCAPGLTELFPGAGYAHFGEYVLANVGENSPTTYRQVYPSGTFVAGGCPTAANCDGQPTGVLTAVDFGKPKSRYRSLSVAFTKRRGEGEHLSIHATYRISRVSGNYEGLYRNDNGQSDPNISSLYDFPDTYLTHSQYLDGLLNTDTPQVLKLNLGYQDLGLKNLSAAVTFKWSSGQLRTPLLAHPVYQNAGEIPGVNPDYWLFDTNRDGLPETFVIKSYTPVERGYSGRSPSLATWDLKLGYQWNLGKSSLDFSVLVNNLFNEQTYYVDDNVESTTAVPNPFYNQPDRVEGHRTIRIGASWSF